jgi:hypothetical protein
LWSTSKTKDVIERKLVERSWNSDGVFEKITIKYCACALVSEDATKIKRHAIGSIRAVDKVSDCAYTFVWDVAVICGGIQVRAGSSNITSSEYWRSECMGASCIHVL